MFASRYPEDVVGMGMVLVDSLHRDFRPQRPTAADRGEQMQSLTLRGMGGLFRIGLPRALAAFGQEPVEPWVDVLPV
jgi:hypothetical protein